MANISLKKDYQDGQVLYGSDLNANNDVTEQGVNDNYRLILELQQDKADNSDVLEDVENLQNQINNKSDEKEHAELKYQITQNYCYTGICKLFQTSVKHSHVRHSSPKSYQ